MMEGVGCRVCGVRCAVCGVRFGVLCMAVCENGLERVESLSLSSV